MLHAKFNKKDNGHVLLETISTRFLFQTQRIQSESVAKMPPIRLAALLLGLIFCVISADSLALRGSSSDPFQSNPATAPATLPSSQPQGEQPLYNPEFAPVYYNRGNVWYDKAEYLNAIESYNNALFLKPDMEYGYFNRGMSYFLLQQYKAAAEDFAITLKHNPNNTYAQIWREVSLLKQGAKGLSERILSSEPDKMRTFRDWPSTVLSYLAGEINEKTFIYAAYNPNATLQMQQYCELWFYVGQRHLAQGDVEQARDAFKKSVETGVTDFAEYLASSNELK